MKQVAFTILLSMITLMIGFSQKVDPLKKKTKANRTLNSLKIDGELNEEDWLTAPIAKDFLTNQPNPGLKPKHRSEVKVVYDNTAIYIGAKLYDQAPDSILKELSQRDNLGNTDWFGVFIDPYLSGQNGVSFILTPAGVQFDAQYSSQGEDENWDAVWEGAAKITEEGWIAEIRIPYSAIRFPDKVEQNWGINFGRMIRRDGEKNFWSFLDPEVAGFLNQFGVIEGINNIKSPVRLSATPFVAGYVQNYQDGESSSWGQSINAGMDVKYGINDAFTLDMTLIPDFGEARSDNQVLNLSPFEVRFNENRQFFTEGTELFNKGNFFYSRRVGSTPLHFYEVEGQLNEGETIVSNPQQTQLLNATKVSGRTSSGLGIGLFNATSKRMVAVVEDSEGSSREIETSPLTNYTVAAFDQTLKNNSFISLINTTVWRNGSDYDANVTGTTFSLNNKKQSYGISGKTALSQKYSPENTELGHVINIELRKTSGKWRMGLEYNEESDTYDINDLGFLYNNNERSVSMWGRYQQNKAFSIFNRANLGFWTSYERLYNPNEFGGVNTEIWAWAETKGFWQINPWVAFSPVTSNDWFEARTEGRRFVQPKYVGSGLWINSDRRKKLGASLFGRVINFDEKGRKTYALEFSPRYRVSDKLNLRLEVYNQIEKNDIGFANNVEWTSDEDPDVIENEIVFGVRNRRTVINSMNVNYNFNNKMALTFSGRHYWSKVKYNSFHALNVGGGLEKSNYEAYDDHNFSFNAFTIDMIYRWRFAPGSDIFVVWKNSIFGGDNLINVNYFENTRRLWDNPQTNSLSLKVIYYLDYLSLQKKR